MTHISNISTTLSQLGDFLGQFKTTGITKNEKIPHNEMFFDAFVKAIDTAEIHNGWFTKDNVLYSIEQWSNTLKYNIIKSWINKYHFNIDKSKTVAIIMAGNIPLVGFHDFLAVLVSGHDVLIKQSSNDKQFLPLIVSYLETLDSGLKGRITFTEGKLEGFDAVLATGSNNTSRYFEYYFKGKPSIIRKNRNSVAVLTGKETPEQLKGLSEDIFRYYGLGCRNVSKLFIPKDYDFDVFFNAMYHWHPIINETKYSNNYDYNKAVYLMSEFDMLENGFLMLKEDTSYGSPIATLFYEYYDSTEELKAKLSQDKEQIQCIVSNGFSATEVTFGETQKPELWDYADNVDTVDFLLKI